MHRGLPWRDLPSEFGSWQSVYTRYRRWCRCGLCRTVPLNCSCRLKE
ncbi:MAG: transposase [Puniceicoccales bacterium]|nr:transposase [Puniceicoccales bacterium]